MKKTFLLFIFLIPFIPAFAQFDVGTIASSRSSIHAPAAPTVTPTGFTPSSATASDTAAGGSLITGLSVTLSNGHTFNGTCGYGTPQSSTDPTGLTTLSSTSGGCNLNVNSSGYTSANDGTYQLTINPCQSGVCLNPSSPNFTLIISASSVSVTPTQMFAANDTPAGILITPFWVGTPPMGPFQPLLSTQSCSWVGDSIVQALQYAYPGDSGGFPTAPSAGGPLSTDSGQRPCVLISSRQFTSADNGNHTGTMNVGGKSTSFTLHVGAQPTGPTAGGNINNIAIGFQIDDPFPGDIPTTVLNQSPRTAYTMAEQGSGYQPGPSGCTGGSIDNFPYPSEHEIDVLQCGTNSDFANQISGVWNGNFTGYLSTFIGSASDPLELRMSNEWSAANGCTFDKNGPFWNGNTADAANGGISPGCDGDNSGNVTVANFLAAYQNMVGLIHSNYPGVKISLYYPYAQGFSLNSNGGNVFYNAPWWPPAMASTVDLVQIDQYFGPNGSSSGGWQFAMSLDTNGGGGTQGLADGFAFAAMRGVPIALDEFCDEYTDGYNLSRFLAFISYLPVANAGYWNTTQAGTTLCPLDPSVNNGAYTTFGQWFGTIGGQTYTYTNVYYKPTPY